MDGPERERWRHGTRRWTGPWHKAPRRRWLLAAIGPVLASLVTAGSIWLLLSGAALPTKPHGPLILPQIYSVPRLLSPGPAGTSSKRPVPSSTTPPAGRAPGSHPIITPDSPSPSIDPPVLPPPSRAPNVAPKPPPSPTPSPDCPPGKGKGHGPKPSRSPGRG